MSICRHDAETLGRAASPQRPGLLSRLYAAMIEGRMRKAQDEIKLHRHLLPRDLQKAGHKLTPRSAQGAIAIAPRTDRYRLEGS
jgi:hypothetical protein